MRWQQAECLLLLFIVAFHPTGVLGRTDAPPPTVAAVECRIESSTIVFGDTFGSLTVSPSQGRLRRVIDRSCGRVQYKQHVFYYYQYEAADENAKGTKLIAIFEIVRLASQGRQNVVRSDRFEEISMNGPVTSPRKRVRTAHVEFSTHTDDSPRIVLSVRDKYSVDRLTAVYRSDLNWFVDE